MSRGRWPWLIILLLTASGCSSTTVEPATDPPPALRSDRPELPPGAESPPPGRTLRLRYLPGTLRGAELSERVTALVSVPMNAEGRGNVDLHLHVTGAGEIQARLATTTARRLVDLRGEQGGEVFRPFPSDEGFFYLRDWADRLPRCVQQLQRFHDPLDGGAIYLVLTAAPGAPEPRLEAVLKLLYSVEGAEIRVCTPVSDSS